MAQSERSSTPLAISWRSLDYVRRVPCKHWRGRDSGRTAMKLSFHSLRHTAISLLKDAGGQESTAMSHRYTHVGKEALSRAAATFPAI
jgi:integrase